MKKKVLVTDGEKRISLNLVRSFGKNNLDITVGSASVYSLGFSSRYCNHKTLYTSPRRNPDEFLKYLLKMVQKHRFECIFPIRENTSKVMSKHKKELSKYTNVPVPDYNIFYDAYHKEIPLKITTKNGIPCAKTYFELDELKAKEELEFPVVIKSSIKHGCGIAICQTYDEFKEKYYKMKKKHGECFVQDFIPNGGEIGVYSIFNKNSEPVALSVQKRIRTIYPYGGISTLRETIKNDRVIELAFKFLKKLKWYGPSMIEFKIDARNNIPKFMEINPRWWGSLALSILSGTDFPYVLYKVATGEKVTPNLNYKTGVKCRSFYPDLFCLLKSKGRLKNIPMIFDTKTNFDILSLKDPLPMFIAPITFSIEVFTR